MRDYGKELEQRVEFIRKALKDSGASGLIFGNSGGKDSALVGILCKKACENTKGIIMPCQSKRNFGEDMDDGNDLANQFGIETLVIDLSDLKASVIDAVSPYTELNDQALSNIAPRLRMTTLYTVAAAENRLVVGTGNKSEYYMGYFTKWGDGAYDINPIADLTATEVFAFLDYLNAPENIIRKAPSAGLYEGQTDEEDMGIRYADIDRYLEQGEVSPENWAILERYHKRSEHKRRMPLRYGDQ